MIKYPMQKSFLFLFLTFAMIGCGGGGGGGNGGESSGSSQNAPASMAGTSISFNPEIEFTDGSNFVYTNDAVGSRFPSGTIYGTYTYSRTGATTASILLQATGIGGTGVDSILIELSHFIGSASEITSFDLTIDGEVYTAEITQGKLEPRKASGSGSSAAQDSESENDVMVLGETTIVVTSSLVQLMGGLPEELIGIHPTIFSLSNEEVSSTPYRDGDAVTFEITSRLELIFNGTTLTSPYISMDKPSEVIWYDGAYSYAASAIGSGDQIQIRFAEGYDYTVPSGYTFIGQFNE